MLLSPVANILSGANSRSCPLEQRVELRCRTTGPVEEVRRPHRAIIPEQAPNGGARMHLRHLKLVATLVATRFV
jgi:hypothetical protein